jgi:hypothetical protein
MWNFCWDELLNKTFLITLQIMKFVCMFMYLFRGIQFILHLNQLPIWFANISQASIYQLGVVSTWHFTLFPSGFAQPNLVKVSRCLLTLTPSPVSGQQIINSVCNPHSASRLFNLRRTKVLSRFQLIFYKVMLTKYHKLRSLTTCKQAKTTSARNFYQKLLV